MNKIFLLADDDSDDADMFREILSEIDASIIFHRSWSGHEVLDILNDKSLRHPDIIFMDINMPGMNGWQCLAKLKSNEAHKHIPVIMYSTSSHQRDAEIALDLGALGFLTKPDNSRELKNILELIAANLQSDAIKIKEFLQKSSCLHHHQKI